MKKTKWILSTATALLLTAAFPVTAFAESYNIDEGSITVSADSTGQYVTQADKGITNQRQTTETVITQNDSSVPTTNTVTISAEAGTTADVTLDGVNIDTRTTGEAAVSTSGAGNVNVELDGDNTLQSGKLHAGLEKNNTGELTTADDNRVEGNLDAAGGEYGAGIGGGHGRGGSNITISGGKVTAIGGDAGAGIGGGCDGNGSDIMITGGEVTVTGGEFGAGIGGGEAANGSNITITGGEVTATGGDYGAGIGGGKRTGDNGGYGNNITVTGGKVIAKGGNSGAGIGGGSHGGGSDIIISGGEVTARGGRVAAGIGGGNFSKVQDNKDIKVSGEAHLKVQGGTTNSQTQGAAIGSGGYDPNNKVIDDPEIMPDVKELAETGYILYYAQDVDMDDADAGTIAVIHYGNTDKHEGTMSITPAVEATCATDGSTIGLQCTCGKIEVEPQTVKATGEHDIVIDPAVASTYTSTGLTEGSHCRKCGAILKKQEIVPVLEKPAQTQSASQVRVTAKGKNTAVKSAATGDGVNTAMYGMLFAGALAVISGFAVLTAKKKKRAR